MKRNVYSGIIKAAQIKKGDLVLIQYWMDQSFSEDIGFLQAEIAAAGATPVLVVQNLLASQLLNENLTKETYNDRYFKLYEDADVVIDMMERPIGVLSRPLEPEKMKVLGKYMGRLFEICSTKKKMLQLRVPTAKMAQAEGMDYEDYRTRMEAAMDIDYELLKEECTGLKAGVEKKKGVIIKTREGACSLELYFEGRNWLIDAGDGDIPCGEIYIAPVEKSTKGTVFFKTIYLPNQNMRGGKYKFEDVILTISQGEIIDTNNEQLNEIFKEYGSNNCTIGELGLGMNPGVTSLCGCAVLDEKMTGTFHLGIGDNTMFGGINEAEEHIDFISNGEYCWIE